MIYQVLVANQSVRKNYPLVWYILTGPTAFLFGSRTECVAVVAALATGQDTLKLTNCWKEKFFTTNG